MEGNIEREGFTHKCMKDMYKERERETIKSVYSCDELRCGMPYLEPSDFPSFKGEKMYFSFLNYLKKRKI